MAKDRDKERRQRRIYANVVTTVTLLLVGACVNDDPASPNRRKVPRVASGVSRQLVGGTFSLPVPSNSAAPLLGGAPWQATPYRVYGGYNIRTRMPATMVAAFNQPPPPDPSSCMPWNVPEGEVNPSLNPMPGQQLLGTVRYTLRQDSAGPVGANPTLYGAWNRMPNGSWVGVHYLRADSLGGFLSFMRNALDGECNGYVKYLLTGDQTITVDFPEILVTSDQAFGPQGTTYTFTAATVGFQTAANQWSWVWQTSVADVAVSQCNGQSVCSYAPSSTGRMRVTAFDAENMSYSGESAVIQVIKCITGDSILDHPGLRTALRRALDSSNANAPLDQRIERVGFLYRDTTRSYSDPGAFQFWIAPVHPNNTPCRGVTATEPAPIPEYVRVAYFHTHPFSSGSSTVAGDILPANCGSDKAGAAYGLVPSDDDWDEVGITPKVPGYIIDKEQVLWFDPTNPLASNKAIRNFLTHPYDWNTTSCSW